MNGQHLLRNHIEICIRKQNDTQLYFDAASNKSCSRNELESSWKTYTTDRQPFYVIIISAHILRWYSGISILAYILGNFQFGCQLQGFVKHWRYRIFDTPFNFKIHIDNETREDRFTHPLQFDHVLPVVHAACMTMLHSNKIDITVEHHQCGNVSGEVNRA